MRGLNIDKATIAGHSMGGFIALVFTLDHPEMVSKLILLGSAANYRDKMAYYQSWVLMHIFPLKMCLQSLVNSEAGDAPKEYKEEALKMFMGTPKFVFLKCLKEERTKYDVSDKLSKIKAPTLIIVGENDIHAPVAMSQFLNHGISGSKLVIIPNAKHMAMKNNSKEVNEAIEEFIK